MWVKNNQKTIILCVPGKKFSNNFLGSYTETFYKLIEQKWNVILRNYYSSNIWHARNQTIGYPKNGKPFDGIDYDYSLWIDSDMEWKFADVQQLLKADKNIIGGMAKMKKRGKYNVFQLGYPGLEEKCEFPVISNREVKLRKRIFKIAATGFSFLLIKRGVFEKIGFPWFRPYKNIRPRKDGYDLYASEDISWCIHARQAGFDIWIDPKVIVGHEKEEILR